MKKIFRRLPFHPFLFALFPIIAEYTNHLDTVRFSRMLLPGLIVLGGTTLILFALQSVLNSWRRAGLGTSLAVVIFYLYAPIQAWLMERLTNSQADSINIGLTVACIIYFGLALLIFSRLSPRLGKLTSILNITSSIALLTCFFGVATYLKNHLYPDTSNRLIPSNEVITNDREKINDRRATYPDILWIVVDDYAREDVLHEVYELDNSEFLRYLENRDFYIARQASSNYGQTALSLSSTMNLDYLDKLAYLNAASTDREVLTGLINQSALANTLGNYGYQIVTISNSYPDVTLSSADIFLSREYGMNIYELGALGDLVGYGKGQNMFRKHYRNGIIWQVSQTIRLANEREEQPRLIFTHLLLPHPPFIFPVDKETNSPLSLADGSHFKGSEAEYIEGYREQLLFTNGLVREIIDTALSRPGDKPIIVLQSDHGPGSHLDWNSFQNSCVRERLSILNAYYFPDGDYSSLSQDISPVNSFRVILKRYFNANLDLLTNRSYFSIWDKPYEFIDTKDRLSMDCDIEIK